jgi:hypothetical protein
MCSSFSNAASSVGVSSTNKTRNASNLHKKYRRTNYVNHSLASKDVDIWNKLDSHLKSINSLIVFKSKLKKSLFVTDSCIYSKYNHSLI